MTDTELLIRDTLVTYADEAEQVDLVRSAKARSRELDRDGAPRKGGKGLSRSIFGNRRALALSGLAVVVVLIGSAFVLGGTRSSTHPLASYGKLQTGRMPLERQNGVGVGGKETYGPAAGGMSDSPVTNGGASAAGVSPGLAAVPARAPAAAAVHGSAKSAPVSTEGGLAATRVVKTGSLGLRVAKGAVPATVTSLTALAGRMGGYVASSHTGNVGGSTYGDLTLRVPVNRFDATIAAAEHLGKETSLTTNAQDVTGKFVDLQARLSALRQVRETYLTILGHARTIGQTLEVQQRVNDVQRQIEELQGELKVLRNQSADATLSVSLSQPGAPAAAIATHHSRHGINKALHTSIDRFSRGFDSIVAALGPLLLVFLVAAALFLLARFGYRTLRRA